MTFLVPYDGSALSQAALATARLYAIALDHAPGPVRAHLVRDRPVGVLAMSVVPASANYARERGWLDADEEFSVRGVVEHLHREVVDIDPAVDFQHERVDGAARAGTISRRLRNRAEAEDVSVVFMGSENAGRIVTPISSVARGVAADQHYELHLVRHPLPPASLEELKSEFFELG